MKKSINVAKEINMILVNEDMELDAKSQLIQIKKILEYGENNFSDGLKNTKINTFYVNYIDKISLWLNQPIELITKRIAKDDLSEVESKYILTNIMIELNESEEQINDYVY
ncbi:MAG: hypothetical protein RR766_05205 [Longicatena sp.]